MKKEDRAWLKSLPNTRFMGWLGFKLLLMERLGIPLSRSRKWSVPKEWQKEWQKAWLAEGRRRK